MITRFRIEVLGTSQEDCQRQLQDATERIRALDGSLEDEWEITDNVGWKLRGTDRYQARIILKRKLKGLRVFKGPKLTEGSHNAAAQ